MIFNNYSFMKKINKFGIILSVTNNNLKIELNFCGIIFIISKKTSRLYEISINKYRHMFF